MLLTDCNLQDKALMGRVLADLKEVASIVWEASAQKFDRMCTLEKMDECLRHTLANGKCSDQTSNGPISVLRCHPWTSNSDTTQYLKDL